ncbi:MAG: EAL domain-containing protein [Nitrosomonadales bacterium]|nr:EAL domain-containing protein [Nitrosomonadales bacterium]
MARDEILPVLYDFAVTIGSETSLHPLLTRTLQRLLFYTSFPAGFVCLDTPHCAESDDHLAVKIDAAVGDYHLIGLIGKSIQLHKDLLCGNGMRGIERPELLAPLVSRHTHYRSFFRLPIDHNSVIVLLAPEIPETTLPLTLMFTPVMALLAKAIVLCRNNDERNRGLVAERNLLAGVFESSSSGVMLTDADVNIIEVNPAFTRITGYTPEEIRGKNPQWLSSGRQDWPFYQEMWRAINDKGHWQGEIWNRRKNGEVYPEWLSISPVLDRDGTLTNYVGIFSDISERKRAEEQIHQLAYYDPLTNLPNRRMLLERMGISVESGARNGKHGAVLFLDLDNFKALNDTQGHEAGDLLLCEVAKRLNQCVRDGDTVARLGGDEFVVLLESLGAVPEGAATQAELVAEKIQFALNQPYLIKEIAHYTSPSIGIVLYKGQQHSIEDLLKNADTAMYEAKTAGRNTIRFFDPAMQVALSARIQMENDLRLAIERKQLLLHYQIQVDHRMRPIGAEVLLRWAHPAQGMIYPMQFIPMAEDTSLIVPIGLQVLQAACTQLKVWQQGATNRDISVSVNVSARQFRQPDFVSQVSRVLIGSGCDPSGLKLELTESTVLENVEGTIAKMRELKQLGIGFSMDDFGTGYSSLQYLKRLPLDQIKIDQSFVRDLAHDANDTAIVKAIIAMADALTMDVIAEGVETEEQRDILELYGCRAFQGYLFGRPVPLHQFESELRRLSDHRAHNSALP